MPDIFTKAKRSEVMSRIRSRGNKDTEMALAKVFRKNHIAGWRRHVQIKIPFRLGKFVLTQRPSSGLRPPSPAPAGEGLRGGKRKGVNNEGAKTRRGGEFKREDGGLRMAQTRMTNDEIQNEGARKGKSGKRSLVLSDVGILGQTGRFALPRNKAARGDARPTVFKVRPDFVFPKLKLAVFVDGCFWHGCPKHATRPKGNRAFWDKKLAGNKARDVLVTKTLRRAGWRVLRIWECGVKGFRVGRVRG